MNILLYNPDNEVTNNFIPHLYGQRLLRPSKIRVYRALAPGQRDDLGSS